MLLVREPKAILVSSYHHARFRISLFDGTLSEFIRDPRWGIDKIMTAYTRWHANRRQASAFIVCSYEKMHKNPEDVLRQTLHLIGIPSPDERIMAEAVKFGRFDNMKAYESTDFFSDPKIRRLNKEVRVEANKVREGKTDSYKNHLSEEDSAYIDKRLAQLGGNPFAAECAIL